MTGGLVGALLFVIWTQVPTQKLRCVFEDSFVCGHASYFGVVPPDKGTTAWFIAFGDD